MTALIPLDGTTPVSLSQEEDMGKIDRLPDIKSWWEAPSVQRRWPEASEDIMWLIAEVGQLRRVLARKGISLP